MKFAPIRDVLCASVLITIFGAALGLGLSVASELRTFNNCTFFMVAIASLIVLLASLQTSRSTVAIAIAKEEFAQRILNRVIWFAILPACFLYTVFCYSLYAAEELRLATRLSIPPTALLNFQQQLFGNYFAVLTASKMAVSGSDNAEAVSYVGNSFKRLNTVERTSYGREVIRLCSESCAMQTNKSSANGAGAESLARMLVAQSSDDEKFQADVLVGLEICLLAQNHLYEADFVTERIQTIYWKDLQKGEPGYVGDGYLGWILGRIDRKTANKIYKWIAPSNERKETLSMSEIKIEDFRKLLQLARSPLKNKLKGASIFPKNTDELLATLDRLKQLRGHLAEGKYVAYTGKLPLNSLPMPRPTGMHVLANIINFVDRPLNGIIEGPAGPGPLPFVRAPIGPGAPVLQGVTNGTIGPAPVLQDATNGDVFVSQGVLPEGGEAPVLQGATNGDVFVSQGAGP